MTKKDYELIAEATRLTDMSRKIRVELVSNLIANIALANVRFDPSRFSVACGLKSKEQ
ncbi:hypothetical protein M0R72_20940 [Candidatus Pacearchaeota archaeon]|jgi:hypothetical protein|nr:hypothetical protein [Candidatus Pacearchaeota archaeon]